MEKAVNFLGALTRETGGFDAYHKEFSVLQCRKLLSHTIKETILHLGGVSIQDFGDFQSKYLTFSASCNSFMKQVCSFTPGIPKVWVSAPTA